MVRYIVCETCGAHFVSEMTACPECKAKARLIGKAFAVSALLDRLAAPTDTEPCYCLHHHYAADEHDTCPCVDGDCDGCDECLTGEARRIINAIEREDA